MGVMDSIDNATFNYSVSQGDLAGAQGALNQSNLRNGAGAGFPANSAATPGLQQQAVNQQVSALTGERADAGVRLLLRQRVLYNNAGESMPTSRICLATVDYE